MPPDVTDYLSRLTAQLTKVLKYKLVGVYVHGSLALGDFSPRSDVDVVAVSDLPLTEAEKEEVAARLSRRALVCPARGGLEFHVIRKDTISATSTTPPFELHIATNPDKPERVVDGRGHGGDTDLLLHFAMLHARGQAIVGPDSEEIFPLVPRSILLPQLIEELRWGERHGSPSYQILNACRAWRFVEEGALSSKTEGAKWAFSRVGDAAPAIEAALLHRRGLSGEHPSEAEARALVRTALEHLESAIR